MVYEEQIQRILTEVGERGISVGLLAKHVYNMNCTLFFQPDLNEVRQAVGQYLLRNSKSPQSLVESTGKRGCYRLNTHGSAYARQLLLDFREEQSEAEDDPAEKNNVDLSLNLFDSYD